MFKELTLSLLIILKFCVRCANPKLGFEGVLFRCSRKRLISVSSAQALFSHVKLEMSEVSHVLNKVSLCFVGPLTINIGFRH